MRNAVFIILIIFVATLLFPGKYKVREFNASCNAYCLSDANNGIEGAKKDLECNLPLDGFTSGCFGIVKKSSCESSSKCFSWCNNVCYGLVVGTGATPNPIEAKLLFIKSLFQ